VTEICVALDGLPLALELAAARVRLQGIAEIAARTATWLDLLTDGASDGPARQRTLRATLEWSHDGLTPGERRLFRRLAVFADSFTAESVEAICNARSDLGGSAIDGLRALLDMSLLQASGEEGAARRFNMLTTMRGFALEQLASSGERDAVAHAHAAYCLVIAEEGLVRRTPGEFAGWLALCEAEHDNHRAALAWLIETGRTDWAMRLAVGLFRYWEYGEYLTEGHFWFEAILRMPAALGGRAERARALTYAASFSDAQGDHVIAYERHLEALEIYRELGDVKGEIRTLNALSATRRFDGDHAGATTWAQQTLERCRAVGDASAVAAASSNLADVTFGSGHHAEGRRLMEEAYAAFAELQDYSGMAWAKNHLGDMAAEIGDHAEALRLYRDGVELFTRLGDRWGLARSACDLGHLSCDAGDLVAAEGHFCDALTAFEELGHRRGVASALDGCARLAADRGDRGRALRLTGAAAALRRMTGAVARNEERRKLERVRGLQPASADEWDSWQAGARMTGREAIDYVFTTARNRGSRSSPDRAGAVPPRSDPPADPSTARAPG
jgi:predicted ATPase